MLQRPFFTPVVVGLWLVTMGWLVAAKILPAFRPGSPPGHQALYTAVGKLVPVAWTVECNGRPIGWALTRATEAHRRGLFVDTRLHVDRLPWNEVLPTWAAVLMHQAADQQAASAFDARGRLSIDERGELRSFSSIVNLPGARDPLVLTGSIDKGQVSMFVAAGDLRYETTRPLPTAAMVGDELSPLATLPGLYEGRRWSVPVYSPLRPGQSPLEILHAEVGAEETIAWNNETVLARVVTYRDDPASTRPPRCRLWVGDTGRVLRQESLLLGARLAFVRLPDEAAAQLADAENADAFARDLQEWPKEAVP